ncbi:MAG TPA: A24 family peptidase [Polyangiaceae bacterium LLY-WYZ-15_(1-7)]|nr:A24 family peptidase [Polyangiaceae bacterium LLY-WYZ-15_(1-7)]HJL01613.1 A24 family peptidase [Polyangiaceae bacterium LLY-WYZ-15_(1-7)]HJL08653.1 A24 family peptidase [Polyangiaceae bacterium LLY-WYZ-15_(1-7)]HJL23357.1 A24 family peptidase [Polyangiaceae bacterium LLY-WYZ-15_(1-7)]HJL33081.1 A24 family peptidase [Polyangiaceae bacterium LLY-WYZ-15_(1-7)]
MLPYKAALVGQCAAIGLALVAAVTDWRRGEIPNWLTLPPLVLAPAAFALFVSPGAALVSIAGIFICGLVPYLLFRQDAIGGGDVKMVAAIGAVAGYVNGLEFELAGFVVAALYALGRLTWEGKLLRTLANSFFIALNPILPKSWRREVSPTLMSKVRMGGAFLVGAVVVTLAHYPQLWI